MDRRRAMLDSGCSRTFLGANHFQSWLRAFELCSQGRLEAIFFTAPKIRFLGVGGGTRVQHGLCLFVQLGERLCTLEVLVVEGDALFLLSNKVLTTMRALVDHDNDVLQLPYFDEVLPLKRGSSDHHLLNLFQLIGENLDGTKNAFFVYHARDYEAQYTTSGTPTTEILMTAQPAMPTSERNAHESVIDIIEHIAQYHFRVS